MKLIGLSILAGALTLAIPARSSTILLDARTIRHDVMLETPRILRVHLPYGRALYRWVHGTIEDEHCGVDAGILLTRNAIWLGHTAGNRIYIPHIGGKPGWPALSRTLASYRELPAFDDIYRIQLAAEDNVRADTIAAAAGIINDSGFVDLSLTVPSWLSMTFFDNESLERRFPLRAVGLRSVAILVTEGGVLFGDDEGVVIHIRAGRPRPGRDDLERARAVLRAARARLGPEVFFTVRDHERSDDVRRRANAIERVAKDVGLTPMPSVQRVRRINPPSLLYEAGRLGLVLPRR